MGIDSKFKKLLKPYMGLPKEIYVVFIARIVNAMGMFVFPLLTLLLTKKIGMSKVEAGAWISIQGVIFMLVSLVGGKLADTIGRKKLIIVFDSLAALCYIGCAFIEPSMAMVYLIMLGGACMGMSDPAHNSLIADLTTPENRDGAFSLIYLGFNIGFALGPLLGGMLFENHLRIFFLGDAITAIIATLLILIFVGETIHKTKEQASENSELEKAESGSIIRVLLKRPILIYFSLIAIGYNFVYSQWGFLIPLHTEFNFPNEGAALYGKLGSFNGLIVMILTPFITSFFVKKKNTRKIVYGGILYVFGFGMLGFISTKLAFFLSVLIFTIGEILITISMMPFIANHTPASHRGRMNSVLPILMGLGYTVAPVISGKALEFISIETAWRYIGIIMIISTLFMLKLDNSDHKFSEKNEQVEV